MLDVVCGEECDGNDDAACPGFCQSDCTCCPQFEFITGLPGGACGRINDDAGGTGTDLTPFGQTGTDLVCGTLYIGGGRSVQPPSPTPNGASTVMEISNCATATALVLAPASSADTGGDRNCSAPGCKFGPPLPIPNPGSPAVSTCLINEIAATPAVGGTLDAIVGSGTITLPLSVTVFVTGDVDAGKAGIQPCPECVGGTCTTGPNAGGGCSTPTSLLTSHDCPPPGTPLAPFGVDLTPLVTATATASSATGDFCGATTGQRSLGCLGTGAGTCNYIEEVGSPAGDLTAGPALAIVQASVFCIPGSGDTLVDTVADLPGPGAVTLSGSADLIP